MTCKVKNTGKRAGDEVVQLYTRDLVSSVTTYEKNLRGFERVHLEPGEEKEVTFVLVPRDFQLLNKDNHWVIEPGMFNIMIGASSEDIRLKKALEIVAYGQTSSHEETIENRSRFISASKNAWNVPNVIDGDISTSWTGTKGEYISFELDGKKMIDRIGIVWKDASNGAKYEIQLSNGGGQFLPIQNGTVKANQAETVTFTPSGASDIRIVIKEGKAQVAEIKLPELKKE